MIWEKEKYCMEQDPFKEYIKETEPEKETRDMRGIPQ